MDDDWDVAAGYTDDDGIDHVQGYIKWPDPDDKLLKVAKWQTCICCGQDVFTISEPDESICDKCRKPPTTTPPEKGYTKQQISRTLARSVYERDGYRCISCGDWHDLSMDHIIPESKGGETTYENLQTMCMTCNRKKGTK